MNKDTFTKLCKKYKLTKIDDNVIYCIENYLLEIINQETTRNVLIKDERNHIVKYSKKRKRRESRTDTGK